MGSHTQRPPSLAQIPHRLTDDRERDDVSIVAVCVGACLGAVWRWGFGRWFNVDDGLLAWGTLAANWVGCFLMGVAMAVFQAFPTLDPVWRLAIVTGFLGALTTFSSFSSEVVGMLNEQRYLCGLGVVALHVFGSLALTAFGLKTTSSLIATRL